MVIAIMNIMFYPRVYSENENEPYLSKYIYGFDFLFANNDAFIGFVDKDNHIEEYKVNEWYMCIAKGI